MSVRNGPRTRVHVSFCVMVFPGYVRRSGIAGSCMVVLYLVSKEPPYCSPQWLHQFNISPNSTFLYVVFLIEEVFVDNRKPFLSVILTLNVFPSMLPYALYCGIYLLSRNEYLVFHVVGFTNNFFEGSGVVFWFLLVIVF